MKTKSRFLYVIPIVVIAASLFFSGFTALPAVSLPAEAPTTTPTPTITPVPLPDFYLQPGQYYFNEGSSPGLHYMRNIAAMFPEDYGTELDWAAYGGTHVIRFGLVSIVGMGGFPYTNTGELNEEVILNFENLLDDAEKHGIYVAFWMTGWGEWNTTGQNNWQNNPFNAVNGGPAKDHLDIFVSGSPANKMWLEFVRRLVTRWKDRKNILAWDVLGEGNIFQGLTEKQGIAFVEDVAKVIHEVDTHKRPITASLGDVGTWPNFYKSPALDYIQTHPYPPNLDRAYIRLVREYIDRYHKPVQIGESGLNWEKPDQGVSNTPNAHIGIEHAIWAGVVSGAFDGRALFWEDGFGVYFPSMRFNYLEQYAEVEIPAERFTSSVDFTDFKPVVAHFPVGSKVWGAAVGNDTRVIGWFRDAGSEPPNWKLQPKLTGQTITLDIPGEIKTWQVDFYDTKTGYPLPGSTLVNRLGKTVTVSLPDFTDDIAFKMNARESKLILLPPTPAPEPTAIVLTATDQMAGKWVGTVYSYSSDFMAVLNLDIDSDCPLGAKCGKSRFNWCSIDLILNRIDGDTLVFKEKRINSSPACAEGGTDTLRLRPDGTIQLDFVPGTSDLPAYSGLLHRRH